MPGSHLSTGHQIWGTNDTGNYDSSAFLRNRRGFLQFWHFLQHKQEINEHLVYDTHSSPQLKISK